MAQRRFRLVLATAGTVVALFTVTLAILESGPPAQALSYVVIAAGALAATAACAAAARRERGRARRAWALLTGAILSSVVGLAIYPYEELLLGHSPPFPSWADLSYLAAAPLAAAGVFSFPAAPRGTSRLRTVLDGLIVGSSLLFVSWVTVLGPLYEAHGQSGWAKAAALTYPLTDVVVASIAVTAAARSRPGGRAPMALLSGGLIALAGADSAFVYLNLDGTYAGGSPIDAAWLAGPLLIALASLRPALPSAAAREGLPSRLGAAASYAAVVLAVGVGGLEQVRGDGLAPLAVWNLILVVALVATRQLLTLLENLSLARTLERQVDERTAELESALEALREAQRLQDQFIANTSHELRTPLTTMVAAASTLLRSEVGLNGRGRQIAEIAERGARRLDVLVQSLLLASAINESIGAVYEPFNLSAELWDAVRTFAAKGKRLEASIPDRLAALGDCERLRAVISHLLANADKFAPDGTTVWVEAGLQDDRVKVVVRDEGPGVPAEFRERIFDRFYQIDGSSTRRHGGVGLGLFLARRLVESMGGRLTIEEVGRPGATFAFTLLAPAELTGREPAEVLGEPRRIVRVA